MSSIYCNIQDVRDLTGLTSADATDAIVSGCIQRSTAQLNGDIQISWKNERVVRIDNEKENKTNGSNRVFYTQHYPIGDRKDLGVISGGSVYCYAVDSNGNRRQIIVSGITASEGDPASVFGGPLYLTSEQSAPANNETLYFSYFSSPVDMETPHRLVSLACSQLAAALCFTRIDVRKVQSFRVGKVAVMKQSQAYDIYTKQYDDTLNRIRQEMFNVDRGDILI